jgi:hypothetical protein
MGTCTGSFTTFMYQAPSRLDVLQKCDVKFARSSSVYFTASVRFTKSHATTLSYHHYPLTRQMYYGITSCYACNNKMSQEVHSNRYRDTGCKGGGTAQSLTRKSDLNFIWPSVHYRMLRKHNRHLPPLCKALFVMFCLSYIMQVMSTTNFVVMGTCCGEGSCSETFDP